MQNESWEVHLMRTMTVMGPFTAVLGAVLRTTAIGAAQLSCEQPLYTSDLEG